MGSSSKFTKDANGNVAIRVTNMSTETNSPSMFTTDSDGNCAVRVVGISGGSGTSDYNSLSNKPQINGITLSGDKSASDLGIKSVVQIEISGTSTYEGYRIPYPTAEEMTAIYNAVVAGNNVQIVDPYDVYYQVLQADSSSSTINIEILYFSTMFILYTLENDTVSIEAHKYQEKITGTRGDVLYINPNGDVDTTKLDTKVTKVDDPDTESLSGLVQTQKEINEEFVEALVSFANGLGVGYNRTKKQSLQNVNGTMTWVDE